VTAAAPSGIVGDGALPRCSGMRGSGKVLALVGPLVAASLPCAALGDVCEIEGAQGAVTAKGVSFNQELVNLAPLQALRGISPGARVKGWGRPLILKPALPLEGSVLDALAAPLAPCGAPAPPGVARAAIRTDRDPPSPLDRPAVDRIFRTGVRAIDGLCSIGRGQRVGLFAGPGAGKSTLRGMIARHASADVSVIGLIGERGREVGEFLRQPPGWNGLERAVVVVATSDETPARRALAPFTATAIAEHFRDQGRHVLLLIDSLTRTARALREIGLAAGEVPVRQGYPPSVYSELPRLLERAGNSRNGSITAIYTILTHAEQCEDALSEELKSLLDGHIVLDERLAERGIFPAIDAAASVSRLHARLHTPEYVELSGALRRACACLKRDKELLLCGGQPDPELAAALAIEGGLERFLSQRPEEPACGADAHETVARLAAAYREALAQRMPAHRQPPA